MTMNKTDYSPEYQDEYQRLWHREAERAKGLSADLDFAIAKRNAAETRTEALQAALDRIEGEADEQCRRYPTAVWPPKVRHVARSALANSREKPSDG